MKFLKKSEYKDLLPVPKKPKQTPILEEVYTETNQKFNTKNTHFKLNLDLSTDTIKQGIQYAIKDKLKDTKPDDKVRVIIEN